MHGVFGLDYKIRICRLCVSSACVAAVLATRTPRTPTPRCRGLTERHSAGKRGGAFLLSAKSGHPAAARGRLSGLLLDARLFNKFREAISCMQKVVHSFICLTASLWHDATEFVISAAEELKTAGLCLWDAVLFAPPVLVVGRVQTVNHAPQHAQPRSKTDLLDARGRMLRVWELRMTRRTP